MCESRTTRAFVSFGQYSEKMVLGSRKHSSSTQNVLAQYLRINHIFCRTPVVLESRRSSQGGVLTPCTIPLDPPLVLISFKGFSGSVSPSRPNSSQKSIAKLNIGVSLCTSPTGPVQNPFHLV